MTIFDHKKSANLVFVKDTVIFPDLLVEIYLGNERCLKAISNKGVNDELVVVSQSNSITTDPKSDDLSRVGVIGKILEIDRTIPEKVRILFESEKRIKIDSFESEDPFFAVRYTEIKDNDTGDDNAVAMINVIKNDIKKLINMGKSFPLESILKLLSTGRPSELVNNLVPLLDGSVPEKQNILEENDPIVRLGLVNNMLNKSIKIHEIEQNVVRKTDEELAKTQKELYLREELKTIQKELGGSEADEFGEFELKINNANMPEYAKSQALKELANLKKTSSFSPEISIIRNYLDLLTSLPWNKGSRSQINIKKTKKILDQDHYGLDQVKERILEYLAVKKLTHDAHGSILCFAGPPGTGKTSIGKSIARSINRKFTRISLGGIRDEAEIRGHRRTYIGAMPGRIIQSINNVGDKNPVFMLDEIDKLSSDFRGDPSSALLEALDPEQNYNFSDHYLEIPFDLSEVLFITTANTIDNIPPALRDRMEVIEFAGYSPIEKLHIAKNFIWPKIQKTNGIEFMNIRLNDQTILNLIDDYTNEAGVRELERQLSKIARKIALEFTEKNIKTKTIGHNELIKYLGRSTVYKWEKEREDQVGVITGLAVTNVGGQVLSIEAVVIPSGKGNLIMTGYLGDIMKESAQAALSYARSILPNYHVDKSNLANFDVHVHVPLGSIPKDGPSAGSAIAIAIISAILDKKVNKDVGITGEISLTGRLLKIGGVKEKILAAKRSGLKKVILPTQNQDEYDELNPEIKKDIEIIFANKIEQVINQFLI